MKRGTRCLAQTINLSDPKTCLRPKRVWKSDSVNTTGSYSECKSVSDRCSPAEPATVEVGAQKGTQRTGRPKLHDCPREPLPLSTGEKLSRTVMFLVKGVITAGLIRWTYEEGIWSDSTKTEELYCRMINTIAPDRVDTDNIHSHLAGIKCSALEAYNRALIKGMDIIVGVPLGMHRKLRDLFSPCSVITETETTASRYSDEHPAEI